MTEPTNPTGPTVFPSTPEVQLPDPPPAEEDVTPFSVEEDDDPLSLVGEEVDDVDLADA